VGQVVPCRRCGRERPHPSRGLCNPCNSLLSCYSFLWASHPEDLAAYPTRPCPARRFTPVQVRAIRRDPRRQVEIAGEYGVAQNTVSKIKLRHLYRDVPDEPAAEPRQRADLPPPAGGEERGTPNEPPPAM
jgi:hypothetical protein